MSTESVAGIDAALFTARWGYWHARWDMNFDQLEAAMAAIDALLDQRNALARPVQAAPVISGAAVIGVVADLSSGARLESTVARTRGLRPSDDACR